MARDERAWLGEAFPELPPEAQLVTSLGAAAAEGDR
jgi:hypothetical protein